MKKTELTTGKYFNGRNNIGFSKHGNEIQFVILDGSRKSEIISRNTRKDFVFLQQLKKNHKLNF